MNVPILSFLILLPFFGALTIFFIRDKQSEVNTPRVALLTGGIHLFLSFFLWYHFDPHATGMQFSEIKPWISSFDSSYHLGVDGLSLFFIVLTSFLTLLTFIHHAPVKRIREYYICFLLLESFLIGVFCAQDLILFYFFFEAVLIPMFLIIGIWGGERRIYASFKFFLYTLMGSVLMLIAFVVLYFDSGTTNMLIIQQSSPLPFSLQNWLWLALFISFAVKIPMWPVHTWLPDAHVEAPTSGSMMLAGILLKLGGYGLLRLSLPILPDASYYFSPLVYALSLVAIIYASLVALAQKDMKKLVAYSSIAHMGFVTLGIFTFHTLGCVGGIFQMLSHGLVSAALFFSVGVVYERFHTREISHYGGLVTKMPRYALFFLLFTLASIGVPGTSGFIGEFFVTLSIFKVSPSLAMISVLGIIVGAAYSLWLYRRVMYDKLNTQYIDIKHMFDLRPSELIVFCALIIPVFIMGLYPKHIMAILTPYSEHLLRHVEKRKTQKENIIDTFLNKPSVKDAPRYKKNQYDQTH